MTTYTLIDAQYVVVDRGLSITDAARDILNYDGHAYEVRKEGGEYCLYCSQGSRNSQSGLGKFTQSWVFGKLVIVDASDDEKAFEKIAAMIVNNDWVGALTAMADADYDKQEADFAAQNSGDE
jgi:hypothetical protein